MRTSRANASSGCRHASPPLCAVASGRQRATNGCSSSSTFGGSSSLEVCRAPWAACAKRSIVFVVHSMNLSLGNTAFSAAMFSSHRWITLWMFGCIRPVFWRRLDWAVWLLYARKEGVCVNSAAVLGSEVSRQVTELEGLLYTSSSPLSWTWIAGLCICLSKMTPSGPFFSGAHVMSPTLLTDYSSSQGRTLETLTDRQLFMDRFRKSVHGEEHESSR